MLLRRQRHRLRRGLRKNRYVGRTFIQASQTTPARAELVASNLLTDEVASYVRADSLVTSLEALTETASPGWRRSRREAVQGMLTGSYPMPIPDAALADLTLSAAIRPSILPPNPKPEVAR
jgi:glutamine phosphoribosylpyrophosphate amidotransferase